MRKTGFTLIELLIVVAIIAILAAIALPNFLEAQTRSKVSRAKADMRSMATALEAYCVDSNSYPPMTNDAKKLGGGLCALSTPIAYMSSIPEDPFGLAWHPNASSVHALLRKGYYELGSGKAGQYPSSQKPFPSNTWMLESDGPDNLDDTANYRGVNLLTSLFPWVYLTGTDQEMEVVAALVYDPTNGTTSGGEVLRMGGTKPGSRPLRFLHEAWSK